MVLALFFALRGALTRGRVVLLAFVVPFWPVPYGVVRWIVELAVALLTVTLGIGLAIALVPVYIALAIGGLCFLYMGALALWKVVTGDIP
ncbi:hypothetical protein ACFQMA_01140 [Halosimplex aquaticum]|uniref:Uncharacterized protein n=1 Tax=Halosimplex aquaticum TaxID=3026162 RepID=A0ABD5XWS6_9EURY|nr:hypothetical protein [Halosimplex aquaticum]